MRSTAYTFQKSYNDEGLTCDIFNLPDEGIYGNDHMMFQDLNNDVIADHIENWITSKIYNGKTNLASFLKFNFITRYLFIFYTFTGIIVALIPWYSSGSSPKSQVEVVST